MTYIVTDACVKCKFTDCVDVCPVNCFHDAGSMLVINPNSCIDCGVCEAECPIEAIKSYDGSEDDTKWLEIGQEFSQKYPQILQSSDPLPGADTYRNETNKFEKYVLK